MTRGVNRKETAALNTQRMRPAIMTILPAALSALAGLSAAALATEPGVAAPEPGLARPGGVYAVIPASDAMDCAQACEADALCMSWTFMADASGPSCELKAVIPHTVPETRATSGLSARAPAFARLVGAREPIGQPRTLTGPVSASPVAPAAAAGPSPAASRIDETPDVAGATPPLPRDDPSDAPILISDGWAPLPLRDRASAARP